jgi:hypothetical protein
VLEVILAEVDLEQGVDLEQEVGLEHEVDLEHGGTSSLLSLMGALSLMSM